MGSKWIWQPAKILHQGTVAHWAFPSPGSLSTPSLSLPLPRFGTVESCSLFPAPGFNNEYQYAFIQMAATHHAALALQELNALEVGQLLLLLIVTV